ncbi:MAG: hypothetical protein PHN41_04370 [Bacteroidales bacterium]|nr:hypothetical protein [Bacteroidales bacterium]
MKKLILSLVLMMFAMSLMAQPKPNVAKPQTKENATISCSKIILPTMPRQRIQRGVAPQKQYPEKFEAFICFEQGQHTYTKDGLDVLDSVYRLAFDQENGKFYKITIIGYDDNQALSEKSSSLARERAIRVFDYFASREGTEYIIRRTPSKYYHSCDGETECIIKYKMPFDFKWINLNGKTQAEKTINGVDLTSKAYILVENNPEEALGKFNDYYFPMQDTTLVSKNMSMLKMPKGALGSLTHTKDTIDAQMDLSFEDYLSFEEITNNYSLVPHKRQFILKAGYFVVKSNRQPNYETCKQKENFKPEITIRLPLEMQQNKARLKFFAKTYTPKGTWEYKAVPTTKDKDKETKLEAIIGNLTAFQLDTIYVGKKVAEDDMSNYFYPAKEGEPGAFRAMGGWLKPYKLDKRGTIIMKKDMEIMLRKPKE